MMLVIDKIERLNPDNDGIAELHVTVSLSGFHLVGQFVYIEMIKSDAPIPDGLEDRCEKRITDLLSS